MTKYAKKILPPVLLLALYFLIYFASSFPQEDVTQKDLEADMPLIFTSSCEYSHIPLLLTDTGTTICESSTTIYLYIQGEKVTLLKKDTNTPSFVPSSQQLLVGFRENVLLLFSVSTTNTLTEIFSFAMPPEQTPISLFFTRHPKTEERIVYLSAQQLAQSPSEVKSVQYEFTISTKHEIAVRQLRSVEMLKVVAAFPEYQTIVMTELFPFLAQKVSLVQWGETPRLTPHPCTSTARPLPADAPLFTSDGCRLLPHQNYLEISASSGQQTTRPFNANLLISTHDGVIQRSEQEQQLLWKPSDSPQETVIFHRIPDNLVLFGQSSTRIGKRVYNCFDFTESPEITLRMCIPIL